MMRAMSDAIAIHQEASPLDADEQRHVLESRRRARLGGGLMLAAPPLVLLGAGLQSGGAPIGAPLFLAGLGAAFAGPPLLASGHLAVQRVLWRHGEGVSPMRGRVAMGSYVGAVCLFGASFALGQVGLGDLSAFYALGGVGVWVGSGVFGVAQGRLNARHHDLRLSVAPAWTDGPALLLVVTP